MTDTLTWTEPAAAGYVAGTSTAMLDALVTLINSDPNWLVTANDTADGWIEVAPIAGPYSSDRYVISSNYVTVLASMLRGVASATTAMLVAGSPDRGAGGPTWPGGRTGDPYSGGTWTKFIEWGSSARGADGVVIVSSRDALVFAATESATGDTWPCAIGRMIESADGSDVLAVSAGGDATNGAIPSWQEGGVATAGCIFLSLNGTFANTTISRTGAATSAESAINLNRINGMLVSSGAANPADLSMVAIPMAMARTDTSAFFGLVRQVKLGGRRIAGYGSLLTGGTAFARYIGANQSTAEDIILLTQAK